MYVGTVINFGDGTLPKHHEKWRVLNEGRPLQWEYYLTHCN